MMVWRSRPTVESISATQLSEIALCQRMVALRQAHGDVEATPDRAKRIEHGDAMHAATERAATSVRKGRCFIATAIFGQTDPRTLLLRAWRDEVLRESRGGRLFVGIYYRVSPALARQLPRCRPLAWLAAQLLEAVIAVVAKPSLARRLRLTS